MKVKLNLGAAQPSPTIKKFKISKQGIQVVDQWNLDQSLIKETAQKLIDLMLAHPKISNFLELVPKDEYPDYYVLIENPISVAEIQQKVKQNQYSQIDDFKSDFMLMFSNCKTYNQPGKFMITFLGK